MSWVQRGLAVLAALVVLVAGWGAWRLLSDGPGEGEGGATGGSVAQKPTQDDATGTATGDAPADESASTGDASTATGGGTAAGDPECGLATVWAAPAILPAVEKAAARATEASDGCLTYAVAPRGASAQAELRGGDAPDVWVPDSSAWPQIMSDEGLDLEVGSTVASSPVLLTGTPQVVAGMAAFGVGESSTWADMMQLYQKFASSGQQPPVTMRMGDPRTDPATIALMSSSTSAVGDWDESSGEGRGMMVVLAQTAVQGDPLAAVKSDPRTLVPATEQQIGQAADAGQELRGLALAEGAGVVRMPFVRLGDLGGATDAAAALETELTGDAAAADLTELHLRPGTDGPAPGVAGVPDSVTTAGPDPDPAALTPLTEMWTVIAPQSRILTLVDISGSMAEPVGEGTTRIDLTREAAQTAISVIPQQTAIGLWYFSTGLEGKKDWLEVLPVRALNEEVRNGVTQQQALLAEAERMTPENLKEDTGLNDSLWAAVQQARADYTPQSISSVLLLTDGRNDDTNGGLSDEELVTKLTAVREKGDRPVTVVLIGIGPDADAAALERLATAAGGESRVLRDPRELPQVFVDVVARRAGG